MTKLWLVALLLLSSPLLAGQEQTLDLDDVMDSAEQWAKENLSDDALRALQQVDREKVRQFFKDLEQQLHGPYVIDLAALKDTAQTLLPLLDSYEETQPYAAWLKAQLDYLDVADQFRRTTPPPKVEPGKPLKPPLNPAPKVQRQVWSQRLSQQPWPEAARPYVPRLKPVFSQHRVPPQLVWLAEVESAFDPQARSPAGAAGLFQLMPATARHYGVPVWPLDHRLRADESAEAAAKYLEHLHAQFKDWRLALAAYNAGEHTVQRLLKQRHATTFDAIATHLPAETQMYVPRVEATLARREGVRLSELRLPNG